MHVRENLFAANIEEEEKKKKIETTNVLSQRKSLHTHLRYYYNLIRRRIIKLGTIACIFTSFYAESKKNYNWNEFTTNFGSKWIN